jgi:hypothetical protein
MNELNVVVYDGEPLEYTVICEMFGAEKIEITEDEDMYDLLIRLGVFDSRSQAQKNWTRTGAEIPYGFNDFENIGKFNKRLTIWRPS